MGSCYSDDNIAKDHVYKNISWGVGGVLKHILLT